MRGYFIGAFFFLKYVICGNMKRWGGTINLEFTEAKSMNVTFKDLEAYLFHNYGHKAN